MKSNRHLFACVLLGCTPGGQESSSREGSDPSEDAAIPDEPVRAEPGPVAEPLGVPVSRGSGHGAEITEIWLDPRASAALSLDSAGGVRLWPELPPAQTDLLALAPIDVPIREPLSLSFARADTHEFVIAAIDTAQSARVIAIRLDTEGRASVHERFTIAPGDPLLELHVLDGGDRLLALGVDHRIRLYDGQGKRLAELTEHGLAPWQLRFAGPPESLQIAMVLAGPTRLQRLTIADDRIVRIGEPRPFELDRGPNGNDLALLPSGRTAVLLRRSSAWSSQWSLQLTDLDTGELRMMWVEVKSMDRPRMHVIDDERVLVEDGSGSGFWFDLRNTVAVPLEQLPESHMTGKRVELPGSSPRTRRHASVVAGLRVIPAGRELIVDPIESDRHYRLGHRAPSVSALAFDGDGTSLARAHVGGPIVVESQRDASEHTMVGCSVGEVEHLAFSDRYHLVLLGAGRAKLCAWRTGELISEIELPKFGESSIHVDESGSGQLAICVQCEEWHGPDSPLRISRTSFAANQFGPLEPIPDAELASWPELDPFTSVLAIDAADQRYIRPELDTRHFLIDPAKGPKRKVAIAERIVEVQELEPSPDGQWVAIVHVPGNNDYDPDYDLRDRPRTLSVWSIAGEIPQPMWSLRAETTLELTWSGDSSLLAFVDPTGIRLVHPEGEEVADPRRRDFHLDDLPD